MDIKTVHLLEGITYYLDQTDNFVRLLNKLEDFESTFKPEDTSISSSFKFLISLDYLILADISGNVADILLKEPNVANNLFKKVINLAIKSEEIKKRKQIGKAEIEIRVILPPIQDAMPFSKNRFPSKTGLFIIKGVIMSRTKVAKYCRSTVYRCPLDGCAGRAGQRLFGDRPAASLCLHCGCVREEFLRARENGDQVLAVLVNPDAFQSKYSRAEGITVCFKDDLIQDLSLGVCYNVTVSRRFSQYVAWGVERTQREAQWRFDNNLTPVGVPQSIETLKEHLKEVCPDSPWALTATLSSQIASHLYPFHSFLQLKTGLLLSLASQDYCVGRTTDRVTATQGGRSEKNIHSEDHLPVPLLAVGPDCSHLLHCCSQLSRRHVSVASAALCGSLGAVAGDSWLEAGALLLATGGVCHLGDWAKFGSGKSSMASQIVAALESGRVDLVAPMNPLVSSPPSLPLRAAVWTFWSGDKATAAAQAQLRTLIEVFGMPFIGDGGTDIEAVADHLLYDSMRDGAEKSRPGDAVPEQDLREYLDVVCSFKVKLTSEASKLLRNYFVASRRERPDCLPLNAIKTMTALAEAHARLCLRMLVTYEDVVLVAYLYEEAISAIFGPSLMSPPLFTFSASSGVHLTIAEQMTLTLRNFSMWLEQYIKSLLSEGSVNCSLPEE